MSAPVIDPESSVLSYPQWLTWEHQFSATNNPYDWSIASGAFPTGMTFQPAYAGTASNIGDTINFTAHGLANGTCIVFRTLTGGTGLSINTRYFVINTAADTFQVSLTSGGAAMTITADYSAVAFYRPGFLTGAASMPGISTVRLVATNAGPTDSAEVLFTISIEPAAAVPDSNADIVWDFATNSVIVQTSSALNLTAVDRDTPILFVKEEDDLIARLRLVKNGSVLDLGDLPDANSLKLVLKELEPEAQVLLSDNADKAGTGDSSSYLVHAKFNGDSLAASLTNYETDAGTFYDALAEFELTFTNPGYFAGTPATLRRTSKTFRIRIERDLGEG